MRNLNEVRREASKRVLVLDALTTAGEQGVTNHTLNDICYRFGGRICELRKAGHDIESIHEDASTWRFVLHLPARNAATPSGRLSDLPALAYMDPRGMVHELGATDAAPTDGKLF